MIDIKLVDHSTYYVAYHIPNYRTKLREYISKVIDYIIENYEKLEHSEFLNWLHENLEISSEQSIKKYLQENKESVVNKLYGHIGANSIAVSINKESKLSVKGEEVKDDWDILITGDDVLYYLYREFGDIFPVTNLLGFESC